MLRRIHAADRPEALVPGSAGLPSLDAETFQSQGVHQHLSLWEADRPGGRLLGRCSLWANDEPSWRGRPTGLIGHYAASDDESAARLLDEAIRRLRDMGRSYAVGPMDGSTWRSYRFLTDPVGDSTGDPEPPFLMEPNNPLDDPQRFREVGGFEPIAEYESAINPSPGQPDPRLEKAWRRHQQRGVRLRPIDLDRFEAELRAIHGLCLVAFAQNLLYSPIDADSFVRMYEPIRGHVVPDLVLLAEAGRPEVSQSGSGRQELLGFVFALPDLLEAQRTGRSSETAIVKTLAVRPGRSGGGLGTILLDRVQRAAAEMGFSRTIHALMHAANKSTVLSARTAWVFRRYTLFGRSI